MLGPQELPPIGEAQLPSDVVALLQHMRLQIERKTARSNASAARSPGAMHA